MGLAQNALTTQGPVLADLSITLPGTGLATTWKPSTVFGSNALVIPQRANGFSYQVTAGGGGSSGATPPAWPPIPNATVVDGALTWTCQGVSAQSRVEQAINAASNAIEQYLNRKLIYGQWTENIGASGRTFLRVTRPPLRSIISISYQGAALASTDYEVYEQQVDGAGNLVPSESGLIYRQIGWTWTAPFMLAAAPYQAAGQEFDIYQVIYLGGYQLPQFDGQAGVGGSVLAPAIAADLPFELEKACIDTAVSIYRRNGWDRNVLSESFADAKVTYRDDASIIPGEVLDVLNRWRRPV